MASLRSSQRALSSLLTQRGARTAIRTPPPSSTFLPRACACACACARARAPPPAQTTIFQFQQQPRRFYSDEAAPPPAPPLLQKLKGDLKTAMRAKDAPRLSVIRTALGAATLAAKTGPGLTTDAQVVAVLRKARASSAEAAAEARAAGRQDLVDGEETRIAVFDEYVEGSGVETLSEEQLREVVKGVVGEEGGAKMGDVMKKLFASGGPLDGKSVERGDVAKVVKEVLG